MSWFSILPPYLTVLETWIIRVFLLLTLVTLLPWLLFILYDIFLWLARSITYEIPIYGGRACGKRRPRRPTFSERSPPAPVRALASGVGQAIGGGEGRGWEEDDEAQKRGRQDGDGDGTARRRRYKEVSEGVQAGDEGVQEKG